MEELLRPVLELSYDLSSGDCEATCRFVYPGETSSSLMDEAVIDLSPLDAFPELQGFRTTLQTLVSAYKRLDCDHRRLSNEHVIAQASLFTSANTAKSLLEVAAENEMLRTELAKEKTAATKLAAKLRERELRRSKAEVLLVQMESKNKELMNSNSILGKRVVELEKSLRETEFRLGKEKEALEGFTKTAGQRDEQVKKLLGKIKAQESALEETKEELAKREASFAALSRKVKDISSEPKANPRIESELRDARTRLQEKETELEILKTMLKNFHSRAKDGNTRFRKHSKPSLEPDLKLPQIRNSSHSQMQGKSTKVKVWESGSEEDSWRGKSYVTRKGFVSPDPGLRRINETEVSRTGRSKSPVSFKLKGSEEYEDLPEIDFEVQEQEGDTSSPAIPNLDVSLSGL